MLCRDNALLNRRFLASGKGSRLWIEGRNRVRRMAPRYRSISCARGARNRWIVSWWL